MYNIKLNKKYNIKLFFQILDFFKIKKEDKIKDFYILKKVNCTRLKNTYLRNRLKRYVKRN